MRFAERVVEVRKILTDGGFSAHSVANLAFPVALEETRQQEEGFDKLFQATQSAQPEHVGPYGVGTPAPWNE